MKRLFYLLPIVLFSVLIALTTQSCLDGSAQNYPNAVEVPAYSPATGLPLKASMQTLLGGCGPRNCIYFQQYLARPIWTENDIFNWCGVNPDSGLNLIEMKYFLDYGAWIQSYFQFIPKDGVSTLALGDSIARNFTYTGRLAIQLNKDAIHFRTIVGVAYDSTTGNGDAETSEICQICLADPTQLGMNNRYNWVVMPLSDYVSDIYEYSDGGDKGYIFLVHYEGDGSPPLQDPNPNLKLASPPEPFKSLDDAKEHAKAMGAFLSYFEYNDKMIPTDSFYHYFPKPSRPQVIRSEILEPFAKRYPYPPRNYQDAGQWTDPTPSDEYDVIRAIADSTRTAKFNLDPECENPFMLLFMLQYTQMLTESYIDEVIPTSREVFDDTLIPGVGKQIIVRDIDVWQYGCVMRSHTNNSIIGLQFLKNDDNFSDLGTRLIPETEEEEGFIVEQPVSIEDVLEAYPECEVRYLVSDLRTDQTKTCQLPMIQVSDSEGKEVALIDWLSYKILIRENHWIYPTAERFTASSNSESNEPTVPALTFTLNQNTPNPFNPVTEISFVLSVPASVSLEVYNIKGQRVSTLADDFMAAGNYTVNWNGTNMSGDKVASGMYLYRLEVDGVAETRKMVLTK